MNQNIFLHSLPDFLEIQRLSFLRFLIYGLVPVLREFPSTFKFKDSTYVVNSQKYYLKLPTVSPIQCKLEDMTYCFELYLTARADKSRSSNKRIIKRWLDTTALIDTILKLEEPKGFLPVSGNRFKNTLTSSKPDLFSNLCIGEIPLMAEDASFIINGTERTIINQMIRSPGVSFQRLLEKDGTLYFSASIISEIGAWFKIEFPDYCLADLPKTNILDPDEFSEFKVILNRGQEFPLAFLLLAFGLTTKVLLEVTRYPQYVARILEDFEECYTQNHLIQILYEAVSEYEPTSSFHFLTRENSTTLENDKTNLSTTFPSKPNGSDKDTSEIFSENKVINFNQYEAVNSFFYHCKYFNIGPTGRYRINQNFNLNLPNTFEYLTAIDLVYILDGIFDLQTYTQSVDEIDNLSNKCVRAPGNIFQDVLRVGLDKLVQHMEEFEVNKKVEFNDFIDRQFIAATFKEFFTTSELSQYLDNINPLADLTHKRRITVLGLNGISAENASFEMRDIHSTHYGRLCPIETPEGQNAGLVTTLASSAQLNSFGFLEAPYFLCKDGKAYINQKPRFIDAKIESRTAICSSDICLDKNFFLGSQQLPVRVNNSFYLVDSNSIDFLSISPLQLFSIATSLVPFFEHNDANRVLMGANMQRQAVPLLNPQKPLIGTGTEFLIAADSGMSIKSYNAGLVKYSSSERILIEDEHKQEIIYPLKKYLRTNGDSCINQKPLVWIGEKVFSGQIIADGPSMFGGELALGRNLLLAYIPWEGYNFEDAVIVSEDIVVNDLLTSIHIEEYETEVAETILGPERLTNNIRTVNKINRRNLAKNGLIIEGAYVRSGDVLVGKVSPVEEDNAPESRILRAIFGKNVSYRYKDKSLYLPDGCEGRVIDVRVLPKTQLLEEEDGTSVTAAVRIYIAQIRKIVTGDKVAGRHGNKGVISKILPVQDMPYLPDGTPVDIIFNPLGVPSRMNVGQLFECLLGFAAEKLNCRFKILPFDENYGKEASRILVTQKMKEASLSTGVDWFYNNLAPGKILLRDGRTGELFDNPIFLGRSYILKLMHLVDDKIHARATGPYSLITQQPLGGRSQNGGQRFGEMEVWALQAYGAAYTLQELLTIRSDDIDGRNNTFDALIHGRMPATPQVPEAFNVLTKELRALGIDLLTFKLNLDPYKRISKSFYKRVDMLTVFEAKLQLQYKHSYLNPRTRILAQIHNEEFFEDLMGDSEF
mgnify:CR=1 FL=1